ncbi:MAG: methyltransferase domain-containing protein [Verrucomicrobia bacterium]|nr:methyltransferase domain-containing protein [Verrucomicrobiota bacterium]
MKDKITPLGWRRGDTVTIPGNYQYRALTRGPAVQRFWHRRRIDLMMRLATPLSGLRALDIGCGSGVIADFLAQQGAIVDAVDTNEDAIRFAQAQFARDNLRFHLATANEMTFPDGSFHLIVCMEVIEHLANAQAADLFRSISRLLSAEGVLLVTTPNYASLWPTIEWLMDVFRLSPPMRGEQHVSRFTRTRLERALIAAGLKVRRVGRFCGMAPFVAALSWSLAERLDKLEWQTGQPLGNLVYALAQKAP